MIENVVLWLTETANTLLLLIPVGIIGIWRWSVWLLRKIIGTRYKPQEPQERQMTFSMVIPVYNEEPDVFRQALHSWAREQPDEIIAVIDHSDKDCIAAFQEFEAEFAGARLIVTEKPGKRAALADGIEAATGEIVALVDSDTIWEEGVLPKLVTPFKDPQVGGVGTRQNVLNPQTIAQRLFDIHLDTRYFEEIRFLAAAGDALTCLSGRTAVYRRAAALPQLEGLLTETFWGKPCISGDDKRLTHLVQAAGWSVVYQENARVFTPGSPKMKSFLKQRLRWTRNSWRADLRALYDGWVWKKPALAFHLLDRVIQPITTLIAPIYFCIALYRQNWGIVLAMLLWWMISRSIKILPHLRRKPSSILMLPVYIATSYLFALFKIFAFFTMNEQGWITRWDSSRLGRVKKMRLAPAYGATLSMVFILGFGMFRLDTVHQKYIDERRLFTVETNLPNYDVNLVRTFAQSYPESDTPIGAVDVAQGQTPYQIRVGDTPELLAAKYGLDENDISISSGGWTEFNTVQMQMPFKNHEDYRANIKLNAAPAQIAYLPENNTILVSGWGAVVDIPTLHEAVGKDAIIEYEGDGVYLLKANILLEKHTTLLLEAPDVSWLKMESSPEGYAAIVSIGGSISIDGIKVSSWDSALADYDEVYDDGRSYILIRNARMDIVDSDLGYLGFALNRDGGQGGVYGVSWRITNKEAFGEELTTGYVENSQFHHNYFGVYTFGATGMVFRNNTFNDNIEYGFDPHDDSNNFIIEYNHAYNNGNHGMIVSKRCVNNIFRYNLSENNALHGIMLDRQSNNNTIHDNVLLGNRDGVAIWDSHNNLVYNNEIVGNDRGVRLNRLSGSNIVRHNQIDESLQYGVYIYDEASGNQVLANEMTDNEVAVYLRSGFNLVSENQINKSLRGIYLTDESSGNQVVKNSLTTNAVAVYLKTDADDFVFANRFEDNQQNIQIANSWRLPIELQSDVATNQLD